MFTNAKWISNYKKQNSTPENVGACGFNEKNIHGSFIFRKEIEIAGTVDSAIISVCGLGYGVFTINGNKVTEDVLTTPFTRYDKTVIYQQYDVTNLLTKGINTIGAYIGNGWYNDVAAVWDYDKADWRDSPKMLLQLDVTYTDGTKTTYVSDSSWKFHAGPSLYNHIREGEIYDARLEISEWNLNGFDDSEWELVSICRPPGGILKTSKLPPERIISTLQATHLGNGIYDFGENTSGWVHIKAKGKTGTEISLKYAEVYKDGDIDTTQIDRYMKNDLKNCDIYIMKGEDWEEYEPTFCYHGFRYVKVTNAPKDFEIYACVVHTDLEKIGAFECSDPMLNKIHQASVRATITNYHGFPVDCPHREQNGWTGDALVSADQTLMNFDVTDAYKKWLWDFKDVQRPSGQLPGVIPCAGWGYNRHGGPSYGSAVIYLPYLLYKNTGDFSLVSDMWENMKLYMEHLNHMADDYIIDFGYGDWLPPKGANICPRIVTDTSYYYTDAVIMAEIADIIGEDSKSYTELASNIKSSFRAKFIDAESELLKSQTFISCCIYQDLLYDNEKHLWAKKLADLVINNGYHIDCGILGTKFIFTSLTEYGYEDVLYKMITNPTCPSYAHWILSGMTTFCETWEMNDSLNHHMFSEVDMWFYKYLAGIKIDKDDITIKPVFLEGLDWVKAHHRDIKVHWTKDKLCVNVPRKAKVILGNEIYNIDKGEHNFEL